MEEMSSAISGHHARVLTPTEIEKLQKDEVIISEFKQNKLEEEAMKNWDMFYLRNSDRFFRDRHWTQREFEELADNATTVEDERPKLLEVGCGVGNFIFPLIEVEIKFFIYACDFSPRAIQMVKDNPLYNKDICQAFLCDFTKDDLAESIELNSIHVAALIFVLSAIHPDKMVSVLQNIFKVMKPGGLVLFRDYGLYDQAMLRFKPGHKLSDNFYVRQDGTRAFYFSEEHLGNLFKSAGFEVLENSYLTRQTVNCRDRICVPRVYIQGKFQKPR